MSLVRQKLSTVRCGKCGLQISLRHWREHSQQHESLAILNLENYPPSFLDLTKHYCSKIEHLELSKDRARVAQLTTAYDTLKMLYFKDFKEVPEERHISPAFEKMAEALAPKNFNFFSGDNECSQPPAPLGFGLKIEQVQENIFHVEEVIQELRQSFLTVDTSEDGGEGVLWGCGLFEGLKGTTSARLVAANFWGKVREVLAGNTFPSAQDIRRALKRAFHSMDVMLKQGLDEVGQTRWSGVTGTVCLFQTISPSRPASNASNTDTGSNANVSAQKATGALVHVANMGCTAAYICRDGAPIQITKEHNVTDVSEKQRVIAHGGAVSSSGQVNCVTTVTRALGFHGDTSLRHCLSQKPFCATVEIAGSDEFIFLANSTFLKYIGEVEACNMCSSILRPSLRKLLHIFTTLPGQNDDDAISQTSTLDYDALVSDFGDESMDSSMVPDNESEGCAASDQLDWAELFSDPIETLTVDRVYRLLSDTMASTLVQAARDAGAVGPVSCSVILLGGARQYVKKRLYFEQTVYELQKKFDNYALSEVSLMSSNHTSTLECYVPPSPSLPACPQNLPEIHEVVNSPAPMLSHKPAVALYQPDVAEHMTLEAGNLVFTTNTGVLKLERVRDNPDYQKIKVGSLNLDEVNGVLSKGEVRDRIQAMVALAVEDNTPTTEKPESTTAAAITPTQSA